MRSESFALDVLDSKGSLAGLSHAVRFLHLRLRVPASRHRGFRGAFQTEWVGRSLVSGPGLLRLLRLVEPRIRPAPGRFDRRELVARRADHADRATSGPGRGGLRESRTARLLQVRGLHRGLVLGGRCGPLRTGLDRAPDRDLVLHLPADRLSGGWFSRSPRAAPLPRLRALRELLPAADRGADRPPTRDAGTVRPAADAHLSFRGRGGRTQPVRDGSRQESPAGRPSRRDFHADLLGGRSGARSHLHGRMDRLPRLHDADLLRLLGVLRHGRRLGFPVRHSPARQLRFALSLAEHHRLLAALGT